LAVCFFARQKVSYLGNFLYICGMKVNLNNIGNLLALKRKEKGMTQSEAGALIGVKKSMVSKIESGRCLNVDNINRLATALGTEPIVELKSTNSPNKEVISYIMTAIIEFANRHKLSIREASNYLNRFKGLDFLSEFYDVEHTLSFNDCIDDLTVICQNNGGALQ
jgi:transcriptional regulator with XRE-family HTH domain